MSAFARRAALVLLVAGLGSAHAGDDDDPGRTPLWRAVQEGSVSVKARSTAGYSGAEIVVQNLTGTELRLELTGSYLKPSLESEQPLALGLLSAGRRDASVVVAAGKETTVSVLTFCMAASRHCPTASSGFAVAPAAASGDAARLLRYWRETPAVAQGRIQAAIWNGGPNPPLEVGEVSPPPEDRIVDLPAGARAVAVSGGVVLALAPSGDLLRATPCERFEKVVAGVEGAVEDVVADGPLLHLLVADAAPSPGESRERRRRVARYDAATAALTDELALPSGAVATGERLVWTADGVAVFSGATGLALVTPAGRRALGAAGDAFVRAPGGAFVLAKAGDRVIKLASRQGTVEAVSVSLPVAVSALAAGADGTYAIGDKGILLRFGADDRLARVRHLLAVRADAEALFAGQRCERVCRSLVGVAGGVLVETDMDRVLLRPEAAPLHVAPVEEGARIETDGTTGELYSVAGTVLRRYDAEKTAWVKVRFKEAPQGR
jgi:hypothetical protein